MSWLKENYDKAALGGAAVITLAVVALIFTGNSGESDELKDPKRSNAFTVKAQEGLAELEGVFAKNSQAEYAEHLGVKVHSFIAYPTFRIRDKAGIHELGPDYVIQGAPLKWWKEYGIDDYQLEGAADKDHDKDGFSNSEEFVAGTNPTDLSEHPNLVEKLIFVSASPVNYTIAWAKVDNDRASMSFRTRRGTQDICRVGDTFPAKGHPAQFLNRFKVTSKGDGVNPDGRQDTYYEIEDTRKQGTSYKLWRSADPFKSKDWTAEFRIETPDGGESFKVNEGGEFSLPFVEGGKGYTFMFDEKRAVAKTLENLEIRYGNETKVLGLAAPADKDENPL